MAIISFQPVYSGANNVFTRDDRAAAIQAAVLGSSSQSKAYGNLLNVWPQLRTYPPNETAVPYVWGTTNDNSGLRVGMAAIINPLILLGNYAYSMEVFADNAHRVYLELYSNDGTLSQTIFSDLSAGSLDPNTVQPKPYNWQFVRTASGTFSINSTTGMLILSFEVQNYNTPAGLPNSRNPAALSFGFQLFQENNL